MAALLSGGVARGLCRAQAAGPSASPAAPTCAAPCAAGRGGRRAAALGLAAALAAPRRASARSIIERDTIELEAEVREVLREESEVRRDDPLFANFVGVAQLVALAGAFVGGLSARQRGKELQKEKDKAEARAAELEVLAEKLRKVNEQLQRAQQAAKAARTTAALAEDAPDEEWLATRDLLREGRSLLDDGKSAEAADKFAAACARAAKAGETDQERKACRGLASAAQKQGNTPGALSHMQRCLELSDADHLADTLGYIADLYAEIDDIDNAGEYYDRYLAAVDADSARVASTA